MTRRPSIFSPTDFTLPEKRSAPPRAGAAASPSQPSVEPARVMPAPPPAKAEEAMFRTSLYLSRAVHDQLREIAHVERKSVHDLIREGLDHVLTSRLHPSLAEIAGRDKA